MNINGNECVNDILTEEISSGLFGIPSGLIGISS